MSLESLANYTMRSRYSKYNNEKSRRENWGEITERVFQMHEQKFQEELENEEFKEAFYFTKQMVKDKKVFGSQRALQYAGESIFKNPAKLYNCSSTYVDRTKVFSEILFMLLSGCGVGFSVQKCHIEKLPKIFNLAKSHDAKDKVFVIPDSIEGWADAIDELMNFYFEGGYNNTMDIRNIVFDYSQIRPKGAHITGGFNAPGPEPLKKSIDIIQGILCSIKEENRQLKPIEVFDIIMHMADAVISGGVRRSACITLFDKDDEEMINAKSEPYWWEKNPQRMRANLSVALKRDEVTKEEFNNIFERTKSYGEPGFVFVNNEQELTNPCSEIGMHPTLYDEKGDVIGTGFSCCNLTEIIGSKCKTEEDFYKACQAAAILGTMQATYTNFNYLDEISKKIVERDALLGVSITGMMDMPDILFNPEIQSKGAEIIKEKNIRIAKILNINSAKRTTCTKPSGTVSILGKTGSGIHPHHSKRYIRRIQSSKDEFCYNIFKKYNPHAVEDNVIGDRGKNVAALLFPCEVPSGSITKNQIGAIEFLKKIKLTQENWIKKGVNEGQTEIFDKNLTHNISNTVVVKENEWTEVRDFIYDNKDSFCGISLLSMSGDKDYKQPPFVTVHTPAEIVKEYGDGSVMASGVIVDGLHAYDNDLWEACNDVLFAELDDMSEKYKQFDEVEERFEVSLNGELESTKILAKIKWIEQAKRFADKYVNGDYRRMTYLLKDVDNWKRWCDLRRDWKTVPWDDEKEETETSIDIDTMAAQACAGGVCELNI